MLRGSASRLLLDGSLYERESSGECKSVLTSGA
jgi:hypothetical protein